MSTSSSAPPSAETAWLRVGPVSGVIAVSAKTPFRPIRTGSVGVPGGGSVRATTLD